MAIPTWLWTKPNPIHTVSYESVDNLEIDHFSVVCSVSPLLYTHSIGLTRDCVSCVWLWHVNSFVSPPVCYVIWCHQKKKKDVAVYQNKLSEYLFIEPSKTSQQSCSIWSGSALSLIIIDGNIPSRIYHSSIASPSISSASQPAIHFFLARILKSSWAIDWLIDW